jgi:uncharacterized repeat protein (TIGR03803 family)
MRSRRQGAVPILKVRGVAMPILLALLVAATVAVPAAQAQTFNVIYSFNQNALGSEPNAGVTLDTHGNVYGTNMFYGAGYGTVYKLANRNGNWVASVLYTFTGGTDGAFPASRVVIGPDGALYGTTSQGGGSGCASHGCGTVFRLSPPPTFCRSISCPWVETVLYRFTGGADGAVPEYGDIIFDSAGAIYGTTSGGDINFGSVYKLTNSGGAWTETTLWTFAGDLGGAYPVGGVVFDTAGNLYGNMNIGVYELSPSEGGWTETVLHTFQYRTEGLDPESNMIFDRAGNLYSDTDTLGPDEGGTIFEMTPSGGGWNFQVLYPFNRGVGTIGTSLIFDAAENMYGVRTANQNDNGEAFKFSQVDGTWTYSVLHEFSGGMQGLDPFQGMVIDANGNLWGTASEGGAHNYGLVYEITP